VLKPVEDQYVWPNVKNREIQVHIEKKTKALPKYNQSTLFLKPLDRDNNLYLQIQFPLIEGWVLTNRYLLAITPCKIDVISWMLHIAPFMREGLVGQDIVHKLKHIKNNHQYRSLWTWHLTSWLKPTLTIWFRPEGLGPENEINLIADIVVIF